MDELIEKLKAQLIEALNLEEITPEDIDPEAPLFGDEGLGLPRHSEAYRRTLPDSMPHLLLCQ